MAGEIVSMDSIKSLYTAKGDILREQAKSRLREYVNNKLREAAESAYFTSVYIENFFSFLGLELTLEVLDEIKSEGYEVFFTLSQNRKSLSIAGEGVLICWESKSYLCKIDEELIEQNESERG